jgi:hypothetical protein
MDGGSRCRHWGGKDVIDISWSSVEFSDFVVVVVDDADE